MSIQLIKLIRLLPNYFLEFSLKSIDEISVSFLCIKLNDLSHQSNRLFYIKSLFFYIKEKR